MIKMIKTLFEKPKAEDVKALDFAHIDSKEKALAAAKNGELFPILLFPKIFGGEEVDVNTVYVPPGIPEIQNQLLGTLARFVEQGLVDQLQVNPEYKGTSFIPSKIQMRTSKEGTEGQFNPTIEIW